MPGRSEAEAVRAFIDPLRAALSGVARAKITLSPGAASPLVGIVHQWTLNDGDGASMRGGFVLHSRMRFKVIPDAINGPFRVTTLAYDHSLYRDDREIFALHWHPKGAYSGPHIHLGEMPAGSALPSRHHLPVDRMTFEQSIRWAVQHGAIPIHDDWEERVELAEAPHLLYRSWNSHPSIRTAQVSEPGHRTTP